MLATRRPARALTVCLCQAQTQGIAGWRQHAYILNKIKRHARTAQNKKRSKAKTPEWVEKISKR